MGGKKSRFGEELEQLLAGQGLNKKALAERIDTSSAYVSSITKGKRNVSPARVTSIGQALGVDRLQMSRLHTAAALDSGFQLYLPDDFDD
jgi:transcriptional regulator with XRE-family HTH domain